MVLELWEQLHVCMQPESVHVELLIVCEANDKLQQGSVQPLLNLLAVFDVGLVAGVSRQQHYRSLLVKTPDYLLQLRLAKILSGYSADPGPHDVVAVLKLGHHLNYASLN